MSNAKILDCTLRDGGYVNDFAFGQKAIRKIITQLTSAGIDIVECGFLEDCEYDPNNSVFNTVEQIEKFLPADHRNTMYVAMACYGEYSLSQLSPYDGRSIDGIRVTFHYNEVDGAIEYCRQIIAKGYKVFVQPVGTTSYTNEQLLELISKVNALQPFAFYLVDTLGLMQKNDVLRFFYLIDHNLNHNIHMGFHSHNNLQLSYSNCQALVEQSSNRVVYLDSSVYGMGRGAGNLNTELIASYLNEYQGCRFDIEPILEVVDEFIADIKSKYDWGYCVPYYLAAINGCHPNYASYLNNKQTLTVRSIAMILKMIEPDRRALFDKELIEQKYVEYQSNEINDCEDIAILRRTLCGKNILLIAPGASIEEYKTQIIDTASNQECVVVSVAFIPDFIDCDYVFISNLRRYQTTFNVADNKARIIHTSNIKVVEEDKIVVNYSTLLNDNEVIRDNTSMLLLNLLSKLSVNAVYLAGMDGYKENAINYYKDSLHTIDDNEHYMQINAAIIGRIEQLKKTLDIRFITPSLYNK